ncbi:MAG TPA: hypothetical protein VF676_05720 [Flavobacterium sp.]|jgi:hypothetical protein
MNPKKCTSLFLAMLLLVSNIGLAFNVHYCEGEIASVSSIYSNEEVCEMPVAPAEKACCAEAAKDHKSCCKDKTVDLQDKSDDIIVKTFSIVLDAFVPVPSWKPVRYRTDAPSLKEQITSYYCDAHAPPLFKLYSQYILYA